jgi:hypothetical protein
MECVCNYVRRKFCQRKVSAKRGVIDVPVLQRRLDTAGIRSTCQLPAMALLRFRIKEVGVYVKLTSWRAHWA